ncbi:hypothetical protein IQ22_03234 [Pseudomonas duriflava]|uniref:Quinol monooxygenase YgiN n=1 Tax=Pseudomonas duriflava TaxID=459528 RepID=A0A562Q6S1_9PSED|nr:hypothetical protein [Pseudomonas duriflava]TWI52465.1 hypothetical protein IQ22_03234 [Pseudomonas duriflava]
MSNPILTTLIVIQARVGRSTALERLLAELPGLAQRPEGCLVFSMKPAGQKELTWEVRALWTQPEAMQVHFEQQCSPILNQALHKGLALRMDFLSFSNEALQEGKCMGSAALIE